MTADNVYYYPLIKVNNNDNHLLRYSMHHTTKPDAKYHMLVNRYQTPPVMTQYPSYKLNILIKVALIRALGFDVTTPFLDFL